MEKEVQDKTKMSMLQRGARYLSLGGNKSQAAGQEANRGGAEAEQGAEKADQGAQDTRGDAKEGEKGQKFSSYLPDMSKVSMPNMSNVSMPKVSAPSWLGGKGEKAGETKGGQGESQHK